MPQDAGGSLPEKATQGVAPGTLSALLKKIASAPEDELGTSWVTALVTGALVGRFELVREIGRGGFGVVWEARDLELKRSVAFKAVRAGGALRLREERLLHEAEAAARLSHPNLVTLFDAGRTDHGPYLILELLRGRTLADRLERGRLPLAEAVLVAADVASGLAHAHGHGVVHRDLKPANVFLCDDGRVKVLDLGLAHAFGWRMAEGGTSGYMAPEQARGAPEDERTDVFALGVILFEMLSGERPFADAKALASPSAAPRVDTPELPELGKLVEEMLAKDPLRRPRDAGDVLGVLESLRAPRAATPAPRRTTVRVRRPFRWPIAAAVLAAALLGGALAAAALLRPSVRVEFSGAIAPRATDGRLTIAVADFANATGEAELDGLSGLFITSLQASGRLRVITRGRMFDLLKEIGKDPISRIEEPLAREVARRAGVGALVIASVRRLDDVYVIELKALDPAKDEYLFAMREQASRKSGLLAALDRLSERTRLSLREEAPELERSAAATENVVTPDLGAYRHYFLGKECVDRAQRMRDLPACEPDLERAVERDPRFAIAWLELAKLRFPVGNAREALANAVQFVDRAPARERLHIRALAAQVEGREDEAAALLRELAAISPDDRGVQRWTADFFLTSGDYEASIPYWRQAMALEPAGSGVSALSLAQALGMLGRHDELRELEHALSRARPERDVLVALAWTRTWLRDGPGAVAAARQANDVSILHSLAVEGLGPPVDDPSEGPLGLRARQGRFREAWAAALALPQDWYGHWVRAALAAWRGTTAAARVEASRAAELEPVLSAGLAVNFAYAGDLEEARVLSTRLAAGSRREQTYRAVVLWRTGAREAAIDLLAPLARTTPSFPYPTTVAPLFLHGELLAEMGRDADAVAALARYASLSNLGFHRTYSYPRTLFLLARSHERLGNHEEARRRISELLTQWKDADPDLPLLTAAKQVCRRVNCAER